MSRELGADLIVSHSEVDGAPRRLEVIGRVGSAGAGKKEEALLRDQIIELELAHLQVQPRAAPEVVEAQVHRLESERAKVVAGEEHHERDVLPERAGGPDIDARK